MSAVAIDERARVALAHAVVAAVADQAGLDLLHVKGPALDPSLRDPHRTSSDADVLVRPDHVPPLLAALHRHGWALVTGFASGSVFEHAANLHHESWGYVDVHRSFPGITADPASAFDLLWADRAETDLAHRPCPVPSLLDQAVLLCLHAARGARSPRSRDDLARAWYAGDDAHRGRVRARVARLGAGVALAAALGELDTLDRSTDRTVDLWRVYADGGTRVEEWRARLRAAPDRRTALRTLVRGVGVNREYAAMALGHEPSRRELVAVFAGRVRTAVRQMVEHARPGGRRDG